MNGSLTWFWLSLFFALLTSLQNPIIKKITLSMDLLLSILFSGTSVVLSVAALMFFTGGFQTILPVFFKLVIIAAILDSLAILFSFYALKNSPISLIAPISSFNPLFTTIIASITLREELSPIKIFGILVVVLGAYLLNITEIKGGIFIPFRKLFSNKSVLAFLLANFIWAITPIFQKQAILQTHPNSPLFTSLIENLIVLILFMPIVLILTRNGLDKMKKTWRFFFLVGPIGAFSTWAAFTAFSLAPLGQVTAIFKLSTLFTIGWGFWFFKEQKIWERLLGASVMIAGTILLLR